MTSCQHHVAGIDTVGGVRVPAGSCGIMGFRPSHGAVSHNGIIPVSTSLDTVGMYELTFLMVKANVASYVSSI